MSCPTPSVVLTLWLSAPSPQVNRKGWGQELGRAFYSSTQSPSPRGAGFMPPVGRCAQAICSFNQAAVLMDLISLAVMKAAPPP